MPCKFIHKRIIYICLHRSSLQILNLKQLFKYCRLFQLRNLFVNCLNNLSLNMAQNNNDEIQNLININQRWEQYAKKQDAEIRQLQSQVAMLFAMNMSNNSSSSSSFEQQTCLSCEETQRTANTYRQEVEKLRNELDKLKQVIGALEERTWSLQQERNELNFCLAEANKRFGSLQGNLFSHSLNAGVQLKPETMQTRENEYQDELVSADARCQVSLNEAWDRCELLEVKLSTAKQALEQASMDAAEELNKAFSENVQIEAKALREAQAEAEKRRLVEKEAQKAIKKAEEQFKELESRNRVAKELLFLPGEEEAIQAGEFKVFSLTPKREHVFQAEALHFRTAESQFYRLLEGLAQQYDLLQVISREIYPAYHLGGLYCKSKIENTIPAVTANLVYRHWERTTSRVVFSWYS